MLCSVADAAYDVLGYVHPALTVPHSGWQFSTQDVDNDLIVTNNIALTFQGAWWYTKGSLWSPTSASPSWFSLGDATFYPLKTIRVMIKPQ